MYTYSSNANTLKRHDTATLSRRYGLYKSAPRLSSLPLRIVRETPEHPPSDVDGKFMLTLVSGCRVSSA